MNYTSTRGDKGVYTASQAVLQGLAPDGGLFVPDTFPVLPCKAEELKGKSYQEIAYLVMKQFLDDYTEDELMHCINSAYDAKFETTDIAPVVSVGDTWYLELFHGATIAFKDMALSILPHLMVTAAKKNHCENDIVILTATSGDTGKAAMAGFADVPGTKIIVFYPKDGVSPFQERQMRTQKGDNTYVVGIEGNFDDAQTRVKEMFQDEELKAEIGKLGYQFSSANSINIGRLVPQVAYYVAAYVRLLEKGALKAGEPMNVTVPTGNFGNILAAYYAKQMGLPIGKLVCASNTNKVLYDFFETGCYDKNRPFVVTTSPSMDILVSSNLERLLYQAAGRNSETDADLMKQLQTTGKYTITEQMRAQMADFTGYYSDEAQTAAQIRKVYDATGYVLDPHTAVASAAADRYREDTKDNGVMLVVSTASPYKFGASVLHALDVPTEGLDEFGVIDALTAKTHLPVPAAVEEVRGASIRHNRVCKKEDMKQTVQEILEGK